MHAKQHIKGSTSHIAQMCHKSLNSCWLMHTCIYEANGAYCGLQDIILYGLISIYSLNLLYGSSTP